MNLARRRRGHTFGDGINTWETFAPRHYRRLEVTCRAALARQREGVTPETPTQEGLRSTGIRSS